MKKGIWIAAAVFVVLVAIPMYVRYLSKESAKGQLDALKETIVANTQRTQNPPTIADHARPEKTDSKAQPILNVIEIQIRKTTPSAGGRHVNVDLLARNTSTESLNHVSVRVEFEDENGILLGSAEQMFSYLDGGAEQTETTIALNVDISKIEKWSARLSGVVNNQGLRDDRKWRLSVVDPSKAQSKPETTLPAPVAKTAAQIKEEERATQAEIRKEATRQAMVNGLTTFELKDGRDIRALSYSEVAGGSDYLIKQPTGIFITVAKSDVVGIKAGAAVETRAATAEVLPVPAVLQEQFIQKQLDEGFLSAIEASGASINVTVTRKFTDLPYAEKRGVLMGVWNKRFQSADRGAIVLLKNNARFAEFSPSGGLVMDEERKKAK